MPTQCVRVSRHSASGIDEHAAALAGWEQRYIQLANAPFAGQLVHLEFADGLKLFRETTNLKISEYFVTPTRRVSLGFPLPGSAPVSVANQDARPGELIVFRAGEGYRLECRGAFDVIGVEFEDAYVSPLSESRDIVEILNHAAPVARALLSVITRLSSRCSGSGTIEIGQQISEDVKARCMRFIGQGSRRLETQTSASKARQAIVEQARAVIYARCQDALSVPEIARRLDVSTRTLEYSFRDVLETTPAAYMKIVKLHGARRELCNAPHSRRVTDIAADWGFWHFGRFASDYRKLFGELPSGTKNTKTLCGRDLD